MGTLLTKRILTGIGDASPPEDEDPPLCKTCEGTKNVLVSQPGDGDLVTLETCPDCIDGYRNTEPDADVGLDWVP